MAAESINLEKATLEFKAAKATMENAARECAKSEITKLARFLYEEGITYDIDATGWSGSDGDVWLVTGDKDDSPNAMQAVWNPGTSISWEKGLLEVCGPALHIPEDKPEVMDADSIVARFEKYWKERENRGIVETGMDRIAEYMKK